MSIEKAVQVLAVAEVAVANHKEVKGSYSQEEKDLVVQFQDLHNEMKSLLDLSASDKFVDKFTYHHRYIAETLFVLGKIPTPF